MVSNSVSSKEPETSESGFDWLFLMRTRSQKCKFQHITHLHFQKKSFFLLSFSIFLNF